jgi:hypothetical protein
MTANPLIIMNITTRARATWSMRRTLLICFSLLVVKAKQSSTPTGNLPEEPPFKILYKQPDNGDLCNGAVVWGEGERSGMD